MISTERKTIRFCVDATANAVSATLPTIIRRIFATAKDSCAAKDSCNIVLAEVLNNIVEHGYSGQDNGMIVIDAKVRQKFVCFEISDFGDPIPGSVLPNPSPPSCDGPIEHLPEGGFGWFLIRALTKNICYERLDGRNCLRFVVPRV